MTKATALDAKIAESVKYMRIWAKFTQPQVAAHLGIAYQSYQKMERPGHSFRISTLDKLAVLYGLSVESFIHGTGFGHDDHEVVMARIGQLVRRMGTTDQQSVMDAIYAIKHGIQV